MTAHNVLGGLVRPEDLAAWEHYCREGSIRAGAIAAGLDRNVFRKRCRRYQRATNHPKPNPVPPRRRVTKKQAQAWRAWQKHGSIHAAAEALGIHPSSMQSRLDRYRATRGLPRNAKPTGWARPESATQEWTTPATVEQRLDALLSRLEAAKKAGDPKAVADLKVSIHRIEVEHYGWGMDP